MAGSPCTCAGENTDDAQLFHAYGPGNHVMGVERPAIGAIDIDASSA